MLKKFQNKLFRRNFLQVIATLFGATALNRNLFAQTNKPNIVFILADDLGYGDLSCYGQQDFNTPHIDSIAKDGLKFLQAYSNSASCTPTRVALITGRYQMRLKVGTEEPLQSDSPKDAGLSPEHPTMPGQLKKIGYSTTLIGKWHLGNLPNFGPLKSGYDNFYGVFSGTTDYFKHDSKSSTPLYEQEVAIDRQGYITNLFGDRAVETINRHAQNKTPFFMSVHFNAPHYPWEGPNDEAESKRIKALIHRDGGNLKVFASMVQSMDENVGKILKALSDKGLSDNTIVIFTSDNGGERFSRTWPFSGMKNELLEGGLRIPSIIKWPGKISPDQTTQQVSISMDWMPTLLAATGGFADPAYPPDGENLLPQILNTKTPIKERKLFWRFKVASQRAIRDGDYKYLQIANNEFLFNVVEDQRERANLKDRHKDIFDRLKNEWSNWNLSMLNERERPATFTNAGRGMADHYGVVNNPK